MIQTIEVSNFKSLGPDTRIDLGVLTVFVGQNGAGKSNVIDLFRFVADVMKIGLEGAITKRNGINSIRRWSEGLPLDISIMLIIEDEDFKAAYSFVIGGKKKDEYYVLREKAEISDPKFGRTCYEIVNQEWIKSIKELNPSLSSTSLALPLLSGDERFTQLEEAIKNTGIYNIFPDALRTVQKYDQQKVMDEHGGNWMSIVKDVVNTAQKDDLILALNKATGDIDEVEILRISNFLTARFRHGDGGSEHEKWFESSQESDGTLRMAGIITALLQKSDLSLIGIEEPELTIHPGAVPIIYDYLIQASRHVQVIVTTHSPELLDSMQDIGQIRIVSKSAGITTIAQIAKDQKEAVRCGLLSLGEIHRSEGLRSQQLNIFEGI